MSVDPIVRRSLVVVSGPNGAGKSTLAHALAARLRSEAVRAASVELDVVSDMLGLPDAFPSVGEYWQTARRAAAGLVDGLFAARMVVVVLEGDFWNPWGRDEFEPFLQSEVSPRYVTLVLSYDTALGRVQRDSARGGSRDPIFLRRNHDAFQARLSKQPQSDLVLDAEGCATAELVDRVLAGCNLPSSRPVA